MILLNYKKIKPINPKGNQPWLFIGRTDAEPEAPIFWPPDVKSWLIRKDPDAEKDWRQEEKGMTEDEMVGCHHWLNGHEFEQIPGDGEGRETWRAVVHLVAKSQTWLCNWTTAIFYYHLSHTSVIFLLIPFWFMLPLAKLSPSVFIWLGLGRLGALWGIR